MAPELFDLPRHERGQRVGLAARRAFVTLLAVVAGVALTGALGQPQHSSGVAADAVVMRLSAPETVRGGLFFEARLDIDARQSIDMPRLVLGDGWLEGLQVNSIEPAAESESSRDGHLELSYRPIAAGERTRIWFQFEVNPTNVGRRSFAVELDDGATALARIDRDLTVLP